MQRADSLEKTLMLGKTNDKRRCVLVAQVRSHSLRPCQAPLSMGFSRQEYWNGLPFPSSGDLPNTEIKLMSPALQADTFQSCPTLYEPMNCRLPGSSGENPWSSSGKSTGMGCHFLRQGIFPTQESNPGLPHCRQTHYHLSHREGYQSEPGGGKG